MRLKLFALLAAGSASLFAQNQPKWLELWNDPSSNVYDVVREFDAAFEGKAAEKGKGWKQFKRWEALKKIICNDSIENCVSQKFKAFIRNIGIRIGQ